MLRTTARWIAVVPLLLLTLTVVPAWADDDDGGEERVEPVATEITGRVVDDEGDPVAGINLWSSNDHVTIAYGDDAMTAADGAFTIVEAPADEEFTLQVSDWEYGQAPEQYVGGPTESDATRFSVADGTTRDLGDVTVRMVVNPDRSADAVDTTSMRAVKTAFAGRLYPQVVRAKRGYTPPKGSCNAGSTPSGVKADTLSAVNWFRAMAGLDPVALNGDYNKRAQAAALIMYRKGRLNHTPPTTWPCYSSLGRSGAESSNLAMGTTGALAALAYMFDDDASNTDVGHRRWLLRPGTDQIGTGDVNYFNAIYVTGGDADDTNATPEYLPWPSAGWFPVQAQPAGRWSFSSTRDDTSLDGAKVTVAKGAKVLSTKVVARSGGYGDQETLVWDMKVPTVKKGTTVTLDVTITDIERRGVVQPPYRYSVQLFIA